SENRGTRLHRWGRSRPISLAIDPLPREYSRRNRTRSQGGLTMSASRPLTPRVDRRRPLPLPRAASGAACTAARTGDLPGPDPSASAAFAFVGGHVIRMDTERVVPDRTVIAEAGRIAAVGPASDTPVPAGAVRIEGEGRYLMPGL